VITGPPPAVAKEPVRVRAFPSSRGARRGRRNSARGWSTWADSSNHRSQWKTIGRCSEASNKGGQEPIQAFGS
jgi:hypothetical protein